MENNQPKKKSAGLTALIALLLIITTVASCFGIYAWAKYISSENGQATAQIAKWNFNVSLKAGDNTVTLGEQNIDLVTTEYNHVASHRIAPGTAGEFDIIIDTTGTEVDLQYDVTLTLANCPRNITFSKKGPGEESAAVISAGGADNTLERTLTFSKNVTHGQNGTFTEKIYWNWPYELTGNDPSTGEEYTAAQKAEWDGRDNADQGKTVTMDITVTGTEMLGNSNSGSQGGQLAANSVQVLAQTEGAINRWESVNYDPGTLTTASIDLPEGASIEGSKLASISLPSGASLSGTISANSASDWVVLDVDSTTGEVKIIPRTYSSTTLQLSGMDGYNNAITALDTVAGIYKNDTYATSSRSLSVEDVNGVEGYDPVEAASGSASASASGNGTITYSWDHRYGMDANLNIVDYGEGKEAERTYVRTPETGYYSYETSNFNTNWSTGNCWLASRCVDLNSYDCNFDVRDLYSGFVHGSYLFYVNGGGIADDASSSCPVVPVVTLKSTVKMDKDNNGVWKLSL